MYIGNSASDSAMEGVTSVLSAMGASVPFGVARMIASMIAAMTDGYDRKPCLGMVVTYNPHTHTASVRMSASNDIWTCSTVDDMSSGCFGFSSSSPMREGDMVLVSPDTPLSASGVIIGRIPFEWDFTKCKDELKDPEQYMRSSWWLNTQIEKDEERTNSNEIHSYLAPLLRNSDASTHIRSAFRPTDVLPGEFAILNQHNCGIRGSAMSCTLNGGGATVRASALTNAIREVCDSYIRHTMLGTLHEFHNGRYLSSERNLAYYQEERLGWKKKEDNGGSGESKVWKKDSEATQKGERQTMRARYKEYSGYFGHIISKYVLRPDPEDDEVREIGQKVRPKEEGVARETVDPSGQYRLSTAGMMVLERVGRIPIPVRIALPTDNGHDLKKDPEVLTPFMHHEGAPSLRRVELYDRQAYDLKNQYARVDGLGAERPDHYVPQESELEPLHDSYDKDYQSNTTVHLHKYDKRRAGLYIGEDGSIIARDAWGSEICMTGGNIVFTCAGSVQTLPGKTALTIAGDDIVQKAQNSVDIHASRHDVRLSATRNMEIVGGADEGKAQGGVVIESRGNRRGPWDGVSEKGEDSRLNGITLRACNQNIVIDGYNDIFRSKDSTRILSGNKVLSGQIIMSSGKLYQHAKETALTSNHSAVVIGNDTINIASKNIGLYAQKGFAITKGQKIGIPTWSDLDIDPASDFLDLLYDLVLMLRSEEEASGGYPRSSLEDMKFSFRTPEQCGTQKNWDIDGAGPFSMYEPAWVQVHKLYETLKKADPPVKVKNYKEFGNWNTGKPFPGHDDGVYVQLEGMMPKNMTNDGFNRTRKHVEDRSSLQAAPLATKYKIRDVNEDDKNKDESSKGFGF